MRALDESPVTGSCSAADGFEQPIGRRDAARRNRRTPATRPPRTAGRDRSPTPRHAAAARSPGGPPSKPPTTPATPARRRVRSRPPWNPWVPPARSAPAPPTHPRHAATRPARRTAHTTSASRRLAITSRMQRRVQQRRVHPEPADTAGRVRQPHLGEHLVAADPHRGQSLECRAVPVATRRQPLVAVGHSLPRPRPPAATPTDPPSARPTRSSMSPRRGTPSAIRLRRGNRSKRCAGQIRRRRPPPPARQPIPTGRQHQRRPQGQLVNHRAADFVAGADRQLDKSRAGKHHRPGRRRDRPANPASLGDSRPVSTTPPEAGSSTTAPNNACSLAPSPSPAASAPMLSPDSQNRRRSKAYVGSSTKPAPSSTPRQSTRHTRDKRGGSRRQEPIEPAVFAAQGGNDGDLSGSGVTRNAIVGGVLDAGDQRGMRAGFDEGAVAVLAGAAHRLVELHRLPDVAVPVVGIQIQLCPNGFRSPSRRRRCARSAARCRTEPRQARRGSPRPRPNATHNPRRSGGCAAPGRRRGR